MIVSLIDEIIGVDTQQGNNLKQAVKNYFETKPINVKLVSNTNMDFNYAKVSRARPQDKEMETALEKYNKKIKKNIDKLKEKNQYCGVSG
jgi:ribosome-associated translation inhibitor RaiA